MNFFTLSFALVVLVAAAFAAEQTDCSIACPAVYTPICAQKRNGDQHTFSSQCDFEAYICKNKESEFTIYKNGECSAIEKDTVCNDQCTDVYMPVCAMNRNGKFETFSNLCHFKTFTCKNKNSGFELFNNGECSAMKKDAECNNVCTMEYKPVCAKNRKGESIIFSNFCEFEAFTCKNKDSGLVFFKDGDCSAIKKNAQCNDQCLDVYKPVCAMNRNGKFETFSNLCHFKTFTCKNKNSGFELFNNGECSAMRKDAVCNNVCTMEYKPVCAKNRKGESIIFSNFCEFEAFTCKNKDSGVVFFKDGDCSAIKKNAQCNDQCLDVYMPVCAMNRNGKFETFSNLCHFKTFTCKNKNSGFELFNNGECSAMKKDAECNNVCTMEYKPVCAKNRKGESIIFSNFCEFEAFTCKNKDSGLVFFKDGDCSAIKKNAQCNDQCLDVYMPVCAMNRNGKFETFSNLCHFKTFTCKNKNSGFELFNNGECSAMKKDAECNNVCTMEYKPVCAKNRKGESIIFSNFCEFEAFTCKNKDSGVVFFKDGDCSAIKKNAQCNDQCLDVYKPVCAMNRNGKFETFSNLCHFKTFTCKNKNSGFELFNNGECSAMKKDTECNNMCTMEYKPVCAKNRDGTFQTFPNMCEFEAFTCKNKNSKFELYRQGECSMEKKVASYPRACLLNFDPMCAKNTKGEFQTFNNLCNFEAFTFENKQSGYEFYKVGQCTEVKKTCPISCIAKYDPICTINRVGKLQSFSNFCEFQMYKCNHNESELEFFRNALC